MSSRATSRASLCLAIGGDCVFVEGRRWSLLHDDQVQVRGGRGKESEMMMRSAIVLAVVLGLALPDGVSARTRGVAY